MTLMFPDPTKPVFPLAPQIQWDLQGDRDRADKMRGVGLQVMEQLKAENVNDYAQYFKQVDYDDGTKVRVQRQKQIFVDLFVVSIYCPPVEPPKREDAPPLIPPLQPGQFYYVPGCVARYGFREKAELQNEIPLKRGSLGETYDSKNRGVGVTFLSIKEAGLPAAGTSPDGSISRVYRVCRMDGADPDSGKDGAGILFSPLNLPATGPFSISCVVRLRREIEMDYSFTPKTREIDNGYTVWNPIKPRVLRSSDGVNWSADCPGSLAPLVGHMMPSRFSDHWVRFTYPWPTYNNNFVTGTENMIGYREIGTVCGGEPLMASDYAAASPYWDKVAFGDLETLAGTFAGGWAENTEAQNTAPYESYCRFNVPGSHTKESGTRAVRTLDDGEKRYATVHSCSYDPDTDITRFILKDYQYKVFMATADGNAMVVFGPQPFPVCHPEGYMIGFNFMGLCWYNGNRILAGKVCDFETEYKLPPIVSDGLVVGECYHVLMTYDADGQTKLYVSRLGSRTIDVSVATQSVEDFNIVDETGEIIPVHVGADSWGETLDDSGISNSWFSKWEFSSFMDMGLLRFYHRALTSEEGLLLRDEVLHGIFVADDFEAAQLIGAGLTPVTV